MESEDEQLIDAVKKGDQKRIRALLRNDPGLVNAYSADGVSAVSWAVYYQQNDILKFLLAQPYLELNIFSAVASGQVERVEDLLTVDGNLAHEFSPDGFQPLGLAAFFGHQEIVERLLSYDIDVSVPSDNLQMVQPLHSAAAGNHTEIARLLLMEGAEIDARQAGGFVPLHSAAQNGNLELVELLLQFGADRKARNDQGQTAVDLARANGHDLVVRRLASA